MTLEGGSVINTVFETSTKKEKLGERKSIFLVWFDRKHNRHPHKKNGYCLGWLTKTKDVITF